MLTALQIIKSLGRIPPGPDGTDRFDRATKVAVTELRRGVSKRTGLTRFLCKTRTPERTERGLEVWIYVTRVDYFPNKRHVQLTCACEDHRYVWEHALNFHGAAEILYSNGDPAKIRNPRNIPGCCKHIVKTFDTLVRRGEIDGNFVLKPPRK